MSIFVNAWNMSLLYDKYAFSSENITFSCLSSKFHQMRYMKRYLLRSLFGRKINSRMRKISLIFLNIKNVTKNVRKKYSENKFIHHLILQNSILPNNIPTKKQRHFSLRKRPINNRENTQNARNQKENATLSISYHFRSRKIPTSGKVSVHNSAGKWPD